jgi:hypothetical protein
MTAQLTIPRRPTSNTARPVRRPTLRNATAIIGVAALIATGASAAGAAGAASGADTVAPAAATRTMVPLAQRLREYRETIIALYGSHPASPRPVNPGTRARRELRSSVAGQYGHAR